MSGGIYFIVPIDEITEEMISISVHTNIEGVNKSLRPIEGQMSGLVEISAEVVPTYMSKYNGYNVQDARKIVRSKEWNHYYITDLLYQKFQMNEVLSKFDSGLYYEAFSTSYIALFSLLKENFFQHHKKYINAPKKWSLFKDKRFEKANESMMLDLNYFYDLITLEEHKVINEFRIKRNDLIHSFELRYSTEEMRDSLNMVLPIVQKYFSKYEV